MESDKEKEGYKPTIPIIRKAESPRVPKDFGEYLIKDEVGHGGMGWIYKAVHKKLEVIRALKILDPRLSQHEEFLGNFKREAQLAAKLHHPNIVTIHNTGEFGGFHYIDMDFIEGDNLAKRLPEKGMDPMVVLAIAVKILDALDYAHNNEFSYQGQTYYGLIHRDIKPENIIIDNSGEVKVTDFGIARGIHLYGDVTTEGTVVGTPSYMSPEQIDGSQKISYTTDLYSLGVVMYELLSGKKAFPGTTTQIIRKISNHECEPLAKLRKIPSDIIKIVDKAMSYNPEERFQSAYEMANAINRYLAQYQGGDATTIIRNYFVERRTPEPVKEKKERKPKKWLAPLGKAIGLTALVILIFIGVSYLYKSIVRHNAGKALTALEERLKRNQVNNASLDFGAVINLFDLAQVKFSSKDYGLTRILCDSATGKLDRLLVLRREAIRTRFGEVSTKIDSAKNSGSEIDFRALYLNPADSLIATDRFDEADNLLNTASADAVKEIKRLKKPPSPPPLPPPLPEKELTQKKLQDAKVQLADAKKDRPDINFSAEDSLITQAEAFLNKGLYQESKKFSEEAGRAIALKMIPTPPASMPQVKRANEHYAMLSSGQREENKNQWERMNDFAKQGKTDAANALAQQILKVIPEPPESPIPPKPQTEGCKSDSECFETASDFDDAGDYNNALKYYEQVKPGYDKKDSWKYYLPARFGMGKIYQNQKQYKKALAEYQRVLDLQHNSYFEACFLNLGECFNELAAYDSALVYFEKVETFKHLIVPNKAKGEETIYDTDLWHYTMYYWASALTNLYYKETNLEKKKNLRDAAIRKWENDYLDNYEKDIAHPRRGQFVRNAKAALNNLKSGG